MFLICPPRWGLSRAARAHSPGSRFLAGPPVELWQGCGQSSAGWSWWQVLVASPAQRTGIGFPSSGSKLFSGNSLQNAKAAGRLGLCPWISVPPSVGRACVNEGPSQCMGGGDPQLLTSRLWPFKYVSGLGEERLPGPQHLQEAPSPLPVSRLRVGGLSLQGWSLGIGVRHLRWLEA